MSNLVYAEVPVGDTTLLSMKDGETVLVAPRHICEKLGINWPNEYRRISNDPILSKAVVKMTTAFSNGQEQLLLPLNYLPGWLFKINLKTVNEASRPMLETIQLESYDALYRYWVKGQATNPRVAIGSPSSTGDILKLVDRLKDEDQPEVKGMLYAMLEQTCTRMALPVPAITAFGKPRPMIAERFFEALAELRDKGVVIDWHRDPAMLALPLREVDAAFRQHGISASRGTPLWAALRAHPAFEMTGAVNCHDDRSRHCWVFVRAKLPVDLPYPEKPSSI